MAAERAFVDEDDDDLPADRQQRMVDLYPMGGNGSVWSCAHCKREVTRGFGCVECLRFACIECVRAERHMHRSNDDPPTLAEMGAVLERADTRKIHGISVQASRMALYHAMRAFKHRFTRPALRSPEHVAMYMAPPRDDQSRAPSRKPHVAPMVFASSPVRPERIAGWGSDHPVIRAFRALALDTSTDGCVGNVCAASPTRHCLPVNGWF